MLMDGIAGVPLVGMIALTIILLTLVAHRELPFKFPGALAAVLIGVILYQIGLQLMRMNVGIGPLVPQPEKAIGYAPTNWAALFSIYTQEPSWYTEVFTYTLGRLPIVLPFALATIIGGIDCTESAAAAGDEYDTRAILLTEGIASLFAGLLGGVIQTTPYIGHPAYKKMGGRAAYTLATALFIGARRLSGRLHLSLRVATEGRHVSDPRLRRPGNHGPVFPGDTAEALSRAGPIDAAGLRLPHHDSGQRRARL